MKLAFICDPLPQLDPGHDTTVAFMEAAQQLGHEVWVAPMSSLSIVRSRAWANLQAAKLFPVRLENERWIAPEPWYRLSELVWQPLSGMDAVFLRTDPPVTVPYLYATQILDLIDPHKTIVVNAPRGLQAANEKLYAMQFESVIPKTIVSQEKRAIRDFLDAQKQAILKPLGGKGGEGILLLSDGDRNLNSLVEISTGRGQEPVMVQAYLEGAKNGDKRIILLDGDPIGAVNRVPSGGDFRGNMAVGGRVEKAEITDRDREICAAIAPQLRADGLYFVGIDVIDGYLTEINVTSPTGVREIDRLNSVSLGQQVIEWLEARVNALPH